jgi:hypothetical protein
MPKKGSLWFPVMSALLAGILIGVSAYVLISLPSGHAVGAAPPAPNPKAAAATVPAARPQPVWSRSGSSAPQLPALPEEVQHTIDEEVPHLQSERDMERYLGELEARARQRHQVTALEIEPGMRAIRQLLPPDKAMEASVRFSQRMLEIGRELDGRKAAPSEDVSALGDRIERTSDPTARQELIGRYFQAALAQPPDQQAAALQRLKSIRSQ